MLYSGRQISEITCPQAISLVGVAQKDITLENIINFLLAVVELRRALTTGAQYNFSEPSDSSQDPTFRITLTEYRYILAR
jgi:hypothetical protein